MKIKRFLAGSMREAMRQVREEQGPDAVILASHTRHDGVEVVAAVDYDEALMRQAVARSEAPAPPARAPAPKAAKRPAAEAPVSPEPAPQSRQVEWAIDPQIRRLETELGELRGLLEATLAATETRIAQAHPNRARLLALMEQLGFSPRIGQRIAATLPIDADETRTRCLPVGWLAKHLTVIAPAVLETGGRVALVGPTGVGKTTTLAKLAARAVRRFGSRQVALISLDTYRIGAEEQLSTYARLLGVPLYVAQAPEQLGERLRDLSDCRCVFIDTPGMSPGDDRLVASLEALGCRNDQIQSWLVLPAGQQREDLEAAVHRFRPARPSALVLSKLDECTRLGGALSVALEQQLPLTALCDGQRVPEDFHLARAADVVLRAMQVARKPNAVPAMPPPVTTSFSSLEHARHG
ncbi:MAG: flagellar biosynthesis protein FlhF [Polycyclovorans sp.]|jgi:flagellar biosynthesis protein FlhF|nr:flagellar biosynthesis protein FlhF [Polycyclovorans sp.]MDP1543333.1 flagellar biosynthesis protein FlhF [Polycyclovorans sp.]|tara:strand:- start:6344 stop:7573 length:1230 start_codon:yes stop_codon:yes gene_type:complete